MEEGFTVKTEYFAKNDNCILVDNYFGINEVFNIPFKLKELNEYKCKDSIGVWKIKSLKN